MTIVIDRNIPYLAQQIEHIDKIIQLDSQDITNTNLSSAKVLVIRSVTKVDKSLLENTSVQLVISATSGINHIDSDYLKKNDIGFESCPGANSNAVKEYVLSGIIQLSKETGFRPTTFGIIGYGKTGTLLSHFLAKYNQTVLVCDPFKQVIDKNIQQVPLKQVLSADCISLHVPLHHHKKFGTYNLINLDNIQSCQRKCMVINSSRGEVINPAALCELAKDTNKYLVLDVFPDEKNLSKHNNFDFIGTSTKLNYFTPHIAGYTVEAKKSIASMVVRHIHRHYQLTSKTNGVTSNQQSLPNHNLYSSCNYNFTKKYIDFGELTNTFKSNPNIEHQRIVMALRSEW